MRGTTIEPFGAHRNDSAGSADRCTPLRLAGWNRRTAPEGAARHPADLVTSRTAKACATTAAGVAAAVAASAGLCLGSRGAGDLDVVLHSELLMSVVIFDGRANPVSIDENIIHVSVM